MDIFGLIAQSGSFVNTLLAFVAALMVIVFVHEFGHYIIGRLSGIRAEVFSIGMGPALWSRRDRHGTRWQIAALPVGGYVKFAGDANAASAGVDAEAVAGLTPEEVRHTMAGAPLWARTATVAAGPVFNFILSIAVFGALAASQGVATDPLTVAAMPPMPGLEQSLEPGDEILAIDGRPTPPLEEFAGYVDELPERSPLVYTVRRAGQVIEVTAPHPYPPRVSAVSPGSAAMDAGLEKGDVILAVNGTPVATFAQMRRMVGASDGAPLELKVWRAGEVLDVTLVPRKVDLPRADGGFETRWLIGIVGGFLFEPASRPLGPVEALKAGVSTTKYVITSSLSGIYYMIAGDISTCNLRGPIGIAETSGQAASQGLSTFVWFIGVLSTAIGFMNLFPIPVLDGGHLAFYGFEAVAGRPPSERAMRILSTIGLALILGLMLFGVLNDLRCP